MEFNPVMLKKKKKASLISGLFPKKGLIALKWLKRDSCVFAHSRSPSINDFRRNLKSAMLVSRAAVTKYHTWGGLEEQTFIVSQFRGLEVRMEVLTRPLSL